ncbi:hypothetical protein Y032_0004g1756 [Ancylostoma ceylanicum]|uniref:Uncharacterized protein n=1 Tax=Ancylostoma ceylanicum TaxID=53326 RepID=A0A016VUN7_9BILA|nr:hypothetical protein Y032_0004g1756 [Ancylostoma ceylanicum]
MQIGQTGDPRRRRNDYQRGVAINRHRFHYCYSSYRQLVFGTIEKYRLVAFHCDVTWQSIRIFSIIVISFIAGSFGFILNRRSLGILKETALRALHMRPCGKQSLAFPFVSLFITRVQLNESDMAIII